jgi:signal transduction histidine kinase
MKTTVQLAGVGDLPGLRGEILDPMSQQAAVAELGQAALSGLDLDGVFDRALALLSGVLDVEYAKILHQPSSGQPLVVKAGRGWGDHVRVGETTVPCDQGSQAGFTLMSNEPVIVDDLTNERRFAGPPLLTDHRVVSGMSVIIPGRDRPYGVLGVHTRHRRRFATDDADFLRSVANIIGSAVQSNRARQQIKAHALNQERRLRYQAAIAECAQILLTTFGDNRLERAIESLLTATQATYVFVERNVVDPELGFCSSTVVEVKEPGTSGNELDSQDYWKLVPWDRMPITRARLERGEPFSFKPDELGGVEHDLYAADPVPLKSELDIPIFTNGEWAGLIGFSDATLVREWTPEDLSLLTTAATMIGAFWEREIAHESLERLLLAKDQFLASASHELRTPLTAIVGYGEILLEESETMSAEERAQFLKTVVGQGADLVNIVNDLLVAAKADIGTLHVTQVPVNLQAQTAQVLKAFKRDQVAHIGLAGDSVRAAGDPDRVRQIIRNLISNALRYGGDTIHIEVSEDDTTAKVFVTDNGKAIPEEDREHIFQPYQRAHNTPGLAGSLGLGLAISRQLAHLMGGDLTYRHQHGESIFELSMPKAD